MKTTQFLMMFVAAAGLVTVSATASAGAFSIAACKACHQLNRDTVGPAFKTVAEKYGDVKTLAAVFRSGFKVEDRKVASSVAKWKSQAGTMTGQYENLIKKGGNEDVAAEAVFEAVKAGKL